MLQMTENENDIYTYVVPESDDQGEDVSVENASLVGTGVIKPVAKPEDDLRKSFKGYTIGPIQTWGMAVGILFVAAGFLNLFTLSLVKLVTNIYCILFGLYVIALESPRIFINRGLQNKSFKWARLTRRLWGRSTVYTLFSMILASQSGVVSTLFGVIILIICSLFFVLSYVTRKVLLELSEHLKGNYLNEEDININVERIYNRLAPTGRFTKEHLRALGKSAGRYIKMNEAHIIFTYLDEDLVGEVSRENFLNGFENVREGIYLL